MKASTKNAIGTFQKMVTKSINGFMFMFTSWRTPDNRHFYLAPVGLDLNVISYGVNPEYYELSYVLLGQLDMIK